MIAAGDFAFLRPLWLLALPALAVAALLMVTRRGSLGAWQRAVDPRLLAALVRRGAVVGAASRVGVPLLATAALLALALAGPAVERKDADSFRNLDATMLVVDLSSALSDSATLQHLRVAARDVAAASGSRQVGMIVYAGDAYVANTLSSDEAPLASTISALESDTVPDRGNRPVKGLSLAAHVLKQAGVLASDVVVISAGDAMDSGVLREAGALAAAGHAVDAVVVTQGDRKPILPDREAAMRELAVAGGGVFATSRDLAPVVDRLAQRAVVRFGAGDFALLMWRDFGRLVLLAAAAAALFLFRRQTA